MGPLRLLKLIPFSLWKLPAGTTRLELVTSGRSVAISDDEVGHSPACASAGAPAVKRSAKAVLQRILVKIGRNGTRFILRLSRIPSDLYHCFRAFIPGAAFFVSAAVFLAALILAIVWEIGASGGAVPARPS